MQVNRVCKKKIKLFTGVVYVCLMAGCASFIINSEVGALGGYAVSRDTIQAETNTLHQELWQACLTVARIRGTIKQEDIGKGFLEVESQGGMIWIRIIRLTRDTVRLRVSARKYGISQLGVAQNFFVKIMEEAR
ncbi:MAG: hypothetical protein KKC84_08030 [Candidatus Omnitrophica bacterium]|nr:hypothetical protein [Candidatus Omnitrophota bacterium]